MTSADVYWGLAYGGRVLHAWKRGTKKNCLNITPNVSLCGGGLVQSNKTWRGWVPTKYCKTCTRETKTWKGTV